MCSLSAGVGLALAGGLSYGAPRPKAQAIKIEVVPGALRYATSRFEARAGSTVSLTLINGCSMPHNLVVAQPGKADEVVSLAMAMGPDASVKNFVPESSGVIAATKLVAPGKSESISLQVPKEPGDYPYLCTFPGHGTVMRGIMRVKAEGKALGKAVTEQFSRGGAPDALHASGVTAHPGGLRNHPLVMRTFAPNPGLDDAVLAHHHIGLPAKVYSPSNGKDSEKLVQPSRTIPAAIAVSFGPELSYVWDTTECRLLYAWTGGFLDMTPDWGANSGGPRKAMDYVPRLSGTLVFKAVGQMPLQLGGPPGTKPKFLGYRIAEGIPEFEYAINGKRIREQIVPAAADSFIAHYRMENPPDPVRLVLDNSLRANWSCPQGGWNGATLEIPADHADLFDVTVKFQPGETFHGFDAKELKSGDLSDQP